RRSTLKALAASLARLAVIQQHTSLVIPTPDLDTITPEEARSWLAAAQTLKGEEVPKTYAEDHCLILPLPLDQEVNFEAPTIVQTTLQVADRDLTLDLGNVHIRLPDPTVIKTQTADDARWVWLSTADHQIFYHLHPADQEPCWCEQDDEG